LGRGGQTRDVGASRCGQLLLGDSSLADLLEASLLAGDAQGLPGTVGWQPHGPRLVLQGRLDRLPHPPDGVGDEAKITPLVEAPGGGDQTHVALGDQVHEAQPPAEEALGDTDDEAQIGIHQAVEGLCVAGAGPSGERRLFLGLQQLVASDGAQVVLQGGIGAPIVVHFDFEHDPHSLVHPGPKWGRSKAGGAGCPGFTGVGGEM
jgi:hypothetical protein